MLSARNTREGCRTENDQSHHVALRKERSERSKGQLLNVTCNRHVPLLQVVFPTRNLGWRCSCAFLKLLKEKDGRFSTSEQNKISWVRTHYVLLEAGYFLFTGKEHYKESFRSALQLRRKHLLSGKHVTASSLGGLILSRVNIFIILLLTLCISTAHEISTSQTNSTHTFPREVGTFNTNLGKRRRGLLSSLSLSSEF